MAIFQKYFKMPLVVGVIALVVYIFDCLVGPKLVAGGSFMWVAFVSWTIFFGVSTKERIQALIGNVLGFLFALLMFHAPSFFSGSIANISIAGMFFVLLANGAMMFFAHGKKLWLHSISGIFMGVFVTFSGLGVALYPTTVANVFTGLGIMLLYSFIGLTAGFVCMIFSKPKANENQNETAEK